MTSLEREVGKLEARMETVESELHAIRSDVREIRDALVGARGGWKTMTVCVAIAASMGAMIGKSLPFLGRAIQ
jgi:chromosome condensin MukBEF ATPase and DNA-binding subunit MukB